MRISDWSSDVCSSDLWIPAPRWQPYRDGNSAGPCDESYIEGDVGQLAGSDSRGNHCQDADKPRTTQNRMPQFRLSFAICRTVRPIRRYPFLRMEIGRAHVGTPFTNAHLVCRLLIAKNNTP